MLRAGKPLVVDADGLHLLAQHRADAAPPMVLTPHVAEAAALLGNTVADVQRDRFAAAAALAARSANGAVILKGAGSVVAGS